MNPSIHFAVARLGVAVLGGVLLIGAGCSQKQTDARCEQAVKHMLAVLQAPLANGAQLAPMEQSAIDAAVKTSMETCRSEGLSQEQVDCILAAKDVHGLSTLRSCPAIVAKKPRWLILPPSEEELDALRKQFGKKPVETR